MTLAVKQAEVIPFSDMERMAQAIAKSGLFGIKTPDQAIALMLVAQSQGRHPASVAAEYVIIQGNPALKSQSAQARYQQAGGTIEWEEISPRSCTATFTHPRSPKPVRINWDWDKATNAGLTGKSNWKAYPEQMLCARVVAQGVRASFPGCLDGVYLAEEVQDFDSRPVSTGKFQAVKASLESEGHKIKSVSGLNPGERVTINAGANSDSLLLGPGEPEIQVIEAPKVEKEDPLDAIYELAEQDKVTEEQILGFLKSKDAIPAETEYVADIKPAILRRLRKSWPQVIEFAVGASIEEAA
jgi:hypothetical protein